MIPGWISRRIYRTTIGRFLATLPAQFKYLVNEKNPLIPPPHKIFIGRGNFETIGNDFFQYFQKYGKISPHSVVLDVGCGIGRMAIPFLSFLSPKGQYQGFDIVKSGIEWCENRIAKQRNNFFFKHVDVFNELYDKKGAILPSNFVFPYEQDVFDFVFLTSVFTHMAPEDIRRYLSEISRVLKKNGKALVTVYLNNEESKRNLHEGKSTLPFKYPRDGIHLGLDPISKDNDIALDEEWFLAELNHAGFELDLPIQYGYWSGRTPWVRSKCPLNLT